MSPSQIKTSEEICDAQQERAALAGGAKAGAANNGPSKVVDAVATGSGQRELLRIFRHRCFIKMWGWYITLKDPCQDAPAWMRDRLGWPIEIPNGRPLKSALRVFCQNVRKLTG